MTKPLHVQVAEALGCKPELFPGTKPDPGGWNWKCSCPPVWRGMADGYRDWPHGGDDYDSAWKGPAVSRYDECWEATGPLIEKYGFQISRMYKLSDPPQPGIVWLAATWDYKIFGSPGERVFGEGETPLVAVCKLILALKEAGKL